MTAPLRERTSPAVRASPAAAAALGVLRKIMVPATVVGAFLAFISAFDSGAMPLVARIPFMIVISFVATGLGYITFQVICRLPWVRDRWAARGVTSGLVMTAPMAFIVWSAVNLVTPPGHGPTVRMIPEYLLISLVTSLFFCVFVAWLRRDAGRETHASAAPARFLERLPLKLRGAEVWAVEAEDHYLRLHTSKGQDLILMRLADAVSELEGIEGAQVHRSWWVARDAIADARRGDGRATLTLKDGSEVPVSRTYAGVLRERGWI
jgi:hypothetical protein